MDLACHINRPLPQETFNHGIHDNMDVEVTGIEQKETER